jgi:hypothetical protein
MKSSNMPKLPSNIEMIMHLFISIIGLPIAETQGMLLKLIIAPYVIYLTLTIKKEHLPALIVLSSGNSIISFLILVSCFLAALIRYNTLVRGRLKHLFWIFLFFFPVFAIDYINVLLSNGIVTASTKYSFYFGLMPLFYGYLLFKQSRELPFSYWLIPIILLFITSTLGLPLTLDNPRLNSMALIIFPLIALNLFVTRKRIQGVSLKYVFFSIAFTFLILIGVLEIKFHHLLSIIIGFVMLLGMIRIYKWTQVFYSPFYITIFMISMIFFAIIYSQDIGSGHFYTEIDYTNFAGYPAYIQSKLFADRGVIWAGAWNHILNYSTFFPPKYEVTFDFIAVTGAEITDVEYGAHNMFLEAILRLGWWGGLTVIIVWLASSFELLHSFLKIKTLSIVTFLIIIAFSTSIGGGLTGQYILMPNFSFFLMSLTGILIGYTERYES